MTSFLDAAGQGTAIYSGPLGGNGATTPTTPTTPPTGPDLTPPTLVLSSPADDATGINEAANIVLTFSETVQAGTGNIVLTNAADPADTRTISVTDATQVTASGSTVTVNPTADLVSSGAYNVTFTAGAIKDTAGNNAAAISSATALNFTVTDSVAPTLTASSPADNATGVNKAANIVLTFSEAVQAGTGNIVLVNTANAGDTRTIAVTDTQVTFSGSTVTINPTADLANLGSYAVTYGTGVIKDASGNSAAGITDPSVLNFTVADTAAPTLVSSSPSDDATDVSKSANIVLNFSETVQAGTGTITLVNAATFGDSRFISVTDATQVTISGSTVTINPTLDLAANGALYSVTYGSGVFLDTAGNSAPAIADGITLNFTVADTVSPTFVSSSPADDTMNVGVDASIVLTYNEAIKAGTGSFILTSQINSADTRTIAVSDTSQVTFSNSMVTINPTTDLKVGTNYQLTFATGVIDDLAGNDALGITSPTALNFLVPATDGADTIIIDTGAVNVQGRGGNDIFQVGSTSAVTDLFLNGGDGADTLEITAGGVTIGNAGPTLISVEQLNVSTFGATINPSTFNAFTKVDGSGTITFSNNFLVTVQASSTATTFQLAAGGQFFDARGTGADRTITGSSGNDNIYGGSGIDRINGGAASDFIVGGGGGDLLTGGDGVDAFRFTRGDSYANNDIPGSFGYDTVTDFVSGTDRLEIDGLSQPGILSRGFAANETAVVANARLLNGINFIGGAGTAEFFYTPDDYYLMIDTNGDGKINTTEANPADNDLFIKFTGLGNNAIQSTDFA